MNKTQRTQIANQLRAAAQKLSAKPLSTDKWDEDGIQDAIKEITTSAMQHDMTPQNFRFKNDMLGWINEYILGPQKKRPFGTPDEPGKKYPSDDKDLLKRIETEVKKALAAAPVEASTKVKAATGVKVVNKGALKDGIWEGEVVSETLSLTDILEGLDQDRLAKNMSDTMGLFDSDFVPSGKDIADANRSKVPDEALAVFEDAASNAYRSAWENAAEGYYVQKVIENVIDLLNGAGTTAKYSGEDSNGDEVEVEVDFDVTAKDAGDVDGIFSNPYIEVTITNPSHLANYSEDVSGHRLGHAVDEPWGTSGAISSLLNLLQNESHTEVKNLGDVDTDHADMDWAHFAETFENNVAEMDPGEIAEAIQTYADNSEESVEDVVDMVTKAIPSLHKMAGAIASALEGGYDARQQKLPLKGAMKALAAAEAAIKAAGNPIANIREKRAAAAKRGDTKAVSFWNAKLRNALSKGPAPSSTTKSKALSGAARKLTPKQQKKLDSKRIETAFYKVAEPINMMDVPKVFKVGEDAIAQGADDAALEKAIHDFVQKIKQN